MAESNLPRDYYIGNTMARPIWRLNYSVSSMNTSAAASQQIVRARACVRVKELERNETLCRDHFYQRALAKKISHVQTHGEASLHELACS